VFIFYGPRSNCELLLHSGFVYDDNKHDRLSLKLGLSKSDPLYSLKAEVLARVLPNLSHEFYVHCDPDCPVDGCTLSYLRVFSLDKETLFGMLVGEEAAERREALTDIERPVNRENESRAWEFLRTRAELLIRRYPSYVEQEDTVLGQTGCSPHACLALQLCRSELRILRNVCQFCNKHLSQISDRDLDRCI